MTSVRKLAANPAALLLTAAVALVVATIVFHFLAPKYALSAERDSCSTASHMAMTFAPIKIVGNTKTMTFTPIHITAKTTKKTTAPEPTTTKKMPKPTIVTMATLHVGAEPGQTIPAAKPDTDLATKRDATVEGHVVMRLAAVSGE